MHYPRKTCTRMHARYRHAFLLLPDRPSSGQRGNRGNMEEIGFPFFPSKIIDGSKPKNMAGTMHAHRRAEGGLS